VQPVGWGLRVSVVRLRILGESLVEVGGRLIEPDSPQLFALALYLGHAGGRPVHKTELLDLLTPGADDFGRASHNLRQLVYRLRRLGVPIASECDRLHLSADLVASTLDEFTSTLGDTRLRCASKLSILPAYEPRISRQLSDWLETVRSNGQAAVRAVLRRDLLALEQGCEWEQVVVVGRVLLDLNAANEDIVRSVAQALLMQGRKHEALNLIDISLEERGGGDDGPLRQLRSRIARVERYGRVRESAFHGRRNVMRELARQWAQTSEFVPQLAVVAGPGGIGKTRLSQELSSYVRLRGGQCLHYTCDRSDTARPYALFRALLPQLRRMRGSLGASPTLQQHLDLLASKATAAGTLETAAAEAMRAEIQQALIDLLEAVSAERPLLIVVDDAHLQDAASRAVCHALVASRADAAVMIMWCYRTIASADFERDYTLRGQVHRLPPLSTEHSVAVLSDLLPEHRLNLERLQAWAARAGGNPYYLHAMAYDLAAESRHTPAIFDISRFAASAYYALTPEAKTAYEACVLLGPLATVQRVAQIAMIGGAQFVSALRELETNGMIRSEGTELRCAHAILEEASSALIPQSVAALLHAEIAAALETECAESSYPAALAWAAADHWIAIGDIEAAGCLLERCASQAAALGEPLTAAQALERIPVERLGLPQRAAVLSQLAEYADAASDHKRVSAALCAFRQVSREMQRPDEALEIDFRIIESDIRHGANPAPLIPKLQELIGDRHASSKLGVRAGALLLIAADTSLDEALARSTYNSIVPELESCAPDYFPRQRAETVFHTVFGDPSRALEIVRTLLAFYPVPTIETVGRRRNIGYALIRLGRLDMARAVILADYDFMISKRIPSETTYRITLLSDLAIRNGELEEAQMWIDRLGHMMAADPTYATAIQGGYYSTAAELALAGHRWDEAEALADRAREVYPAIVAPRFSAIALSIHLRAQLGRDRCPATKALLPMLRALYVRGRHLGMQDEVVEALWLAEVLAGRPDSASSLLSDYLAIHRREFGRASWSLRTNTSADPVWDGIALPVVIQ
jgi:DNA-binding SARP family transcriptional activator